MKTILERISEIANNENITITALEKKIGASAGVLSRAIRNNTDIQAKWVQCIIENYPLYNANWLLTGEGSVLKTESTTHTLPLEIEKKEYIEETRPRIPMDAAVGSLTATADSFTMDNYEQLPVVKAFTRYDFTIFVTGDSMVPEYNSGDELACLYIKDTKFVQWNRTHVLDTSQGIIAKRIIDAGTHILCKSDNTEYPDFRIPKTEVYNIALVVGLIRRY